MLKREGLVINHKRTERLYREKSLSLRLKKRKKKASILRVKLPEVVARLIETLSIQWYEAGKF